MMCLFIYEIALVFPPLFAPLSYIIVNYMSHLIHKSLFFWGGGSESSAFTLSNCVDSLDKPFLGG